MTSKEQTVAKAIELLQEHPHGLRYTELHKAIRAALPDANPNTIGGTIGNLEVQLPAQVYKPARGMYIHAMFRETGSPTGPPSVPPVPSKPKVREEQFYEAFADWLIKELEECTKAVPVGGNLFKDKWGTPDVVGVREPKKSDIVKLPTEIASTGLCPMFASSVIAFETACTTWDTRKGISSSTTSRERKCPTTSSSIGADRSLLTS